MLIAPVEYPIVSIDLDQMFPVRARTGSVRSMILTRS